MNTADRIVKAVSDNPYLKISQIARDFSTSRSQVRRVLKRNNLYSGLKRKPYFTIINQEYKEVTEVEVILCDFHIPYHDKKAVGIALGYAKQLKPDRIRILGDLVDFKSISFWDRKRDEDHLLEEIENARDALWQISETFKEVVFHKGNHEERWNRHVTGEHLDDIDGNGIDDILFLDHFGIDYIDSLENRQLYGEWPHHGELYFLHGDETKASFSGVNIARNVMKRTRDNTIVGHFHRTQEHYETNPMNGDVFGSWTVGCLCDLNPSFAPINSWNHGFAIVYYHSDGTFHVENRKIIEGRIL
jgi:hypothetical protein